MDAIQPGVHPMNINTDFERGWIECHQAMLGTSRMHKRALRYLDAIDELASDTEADAIMERPNDLGPSTAPPISMPLRPSPAAGVFP